MCIRDRSFSRHDLPIDLPAIERFRQRGGKDREYILPELLRIGWSDTSSAQERAGSQASLRHCAQGVAESGRQAAGQRLDDSLAAA